MSDYAKLEPEIKAAWISALPNFPKGKNELVTYDREAAEPVGYCCLGVFKECFGLSNRYLVDDPSTGDYVFLDDLFVDWGAQKTLAQINDRTDDFDEVIEWIKENL